ncbi:Calmodulin [Acropora cervicornis]|uniref:Calmodulin n=1 Tax=Acropora cervicornis TaxID=6130 RepID=A0AAD9UVL0_ACRCE|nr:Calmodulin [Acropora cervicornis]
MGSWLAKLAGHGDDAAKVPKDPTSIAAFILVFGLAFLILLLWFVIIIVTAIRVCKKCPRKEAPFKSTVDLQLRRRMVNSLRYHTSANDLRAAELQMVDVRTKPGPALPRHQSAKLGIELAGSDESNFLHGDAGIFVASINDFRMEKVSLKYAKEVMEALRQAEGNLTFCIKRAPLREQRVNEAFSLYYDDEETGRSHVEAFSIFDIRGSGKIPMKRLFPLIRSLGYNIHKNEAFQYINELDLTEKPKITFNELIKFLEHVVADQTAKIEIQYVYNVFDRDQEGHVPINELIVALERLYEKKLAVEELQEILYLADLDKDGSIKEEEKDVCHMETHDYDYVRVGLFA